MVEYRILCLRWVADDLGKLLEKGALPLDDCDEDGWRMRIRELKLTAAYFESTLGVPHGTIK